MADIDLTQPIGDDFEIPMIPEGTYDATVTSAQWKTYENQDGSVNLVFRVNLAFQTDEGKREMETKNITVQSDTLPRFVLRNNLRDLKFLQEKAGLDKSASYEDLAEAVRNLDVAIQVRHYQTKDGRSGMAIDFIR